MKKLLAILFAAVLCIALGVTAWADEAADYTIVLYEGKIHKNTYNGEIITVPGLTGNPTADSNGVYTYTFNGVNFESTKGNAIDVQDENAEIFLTGETPSNIKGGSVDSTIAGIVHEENGTLTISGSGTLNVTAGNTKFTNGKSSGIITYGNLVISGSVKINATGGNAVVESRGILASNRITISGTANVTATGGEGGYSYGICSNSGESRISGNATVVANGGTATDHSNGINVIDIKISDTVKITGIGGKYGIRATKLDLSGLTEGGIIVAQGNTTDSQAVYYSSAVNLPSNGWKYKDSATDTNYEDGVNGNFATLKNGKYLEIVVGDVEHTHNYDETTWKSDDTNHWHECACGAKKDEATHSFSDWSIDSSDTTKHTKKCDTCQKAVTEEHVYDGNSDSTCNKCIHTRTVYYIISFNKNGATSGTMANATVEAGEYTLPACTFTAPEGKQFKGWSADAEGSITYFAGVSIEVVADTVLYAIWEDIPVTTYTVSFDANGGSGTMNAVTGVSDSYNLPDCTFTAPAGKEFEGWATSAAGEVIAGTTMTVDNNVTLYAQWRNVGVGDDEESDPDPKPEAKPEPCDHKLDEKGKCSRCGVVIISYPRDEAEANPNTGAPAVNGFAAIAVLAAGAICLGKRK